MESSLNIGIDASKAVLEIAVEGQRHTTQLANTPAAIKTWLSTLRSCCRIGIESTGHYHQLLVRSAIELGHTVYVLNPHDLSHYMRSKGRRAKTDLLDAQGIADYVAREHADLYPYQLPTELQAQLDELTRRRHGVVEMRVSLRQSFAETKIKPLALQRALNALQGLLTEIDGRMAKLIAKDPHLSKHAERLKSVVGFGPLLSSVMAHALTRHPFTRGDSFIAYIGLDPRADDSGKSKGRRFLTKRGPAELRRLLYVAAMAASRTKLWRPIYERYRARGLASTEAFVIIARKLARIAFSIVKHGTAFRPELLQETACAKS
jgi:transposase